MVHLWHPFPGNRASVRRTTLRGLPLCSPGTRAPSPTASSPEEQPCTLVRDPGCPSHGGRAPLSARFPRLPCSWARTGQKLSQRHLAPTSREPGSRAAGTTRRPPGWGSQGGVWTEKAGSHVQVQHSVSGVHWTPAARHPGTLFLLLVPQAERLPPKHSTSPECRGPRPPCSPRDGQHPPKSKNILQHLLPAPAHPASLHAPATL